MRPYQTPQLKQPSEKLPLSGNQMGLLVESLLQAGRTCRLLARGSSMFPAIRDGDTVTVGPLADHPLCRGEIVVFLRPGDGNLQIHRLLSSANGVLRARGDHRPSDDGAIPLSCVIGRVLSVQRHGRRVRFGEGRAGRVIATLSHHGKLYPLVHGIACAYRKLRGLD